MKVAAYQAPLAATRTTEMLGLVREQVQRCEALGVEILCCPEAVLGGLADNADQLPSIAIDVERGDLNAMLAPLASDTVTTILGFTEIDRTGSLFNSAAVFHRGAVLGVYRKMHPAINRSIYQPGRDVPVFTVGGLTFGIIICLDSTFAEPARMMASRGAVALFVPTNNGLPAAKGGPELAADARQCDVGLTTANGVTVIRADVAGQAGDFVSYGSSGIVDRAGLLVASARMLEPDLIVADIADARSERGADDFRSAANA
jgi:5-aminopentanamidase